MKKFSYELISVGNLLKFIMLLGFIAIGICVNQANAMVLQGGVSEVGEARQESFDNVQYKTNLNSVPQVDPEYDDHQNALRANLTKLPNGRIAVFTDKSYAIRPSKSKVAYYYNSSGVLQYVQFDTGATPAYPYKAYKYRYPAGNLVAIIYYKSFDEQFTFLPDGTLLGHWIGDKCYDENNNLIVNRKSRWLGQ